MASDNAVGSRLPLLLVMLMILPSILTIASSPDEPIELSGDRISNESIEIPFYSDFDLGGNYEDPSHGWYGDKENKEEHHSSTERRPMSRSRIGAIELERTLSRVGTL